MPTVSPDNRPQPDRHKAPPGAALNTFSTALMDVVRERIKQDAKWGEQNHDPITYLAILMEEVGEMAQAALQLRFPPTGPEGTALDPTAPHAAAVALYEEAVQTAAVALAIVECLHRDKWRWPREHECA